MENFDKKVEEAVEKYLRKKDRNAALIDNFSRLLERQTLIESIQSLLEEIFINTLSLNQQILSPQKIPIAEIPEMRLQKMEKEINLLFQHQYLYSLQSSNEGKFLQSYNVLQKVEVIKADLMEIYSDLQRQQRGNITNNQEKSNYYMTIMTDLDKRIRSMENEILQIHQQHDKKKKK